MANEHEHEFEEWEVKEDPICKKCGMTANDIKTPKNCTPE